MFSGLRVALLYGLFEDCWARVRMSLDIKYGRPNAARTKTRNGFLDGEGGDDVELFEAEEGGRPRKDAKAEGVREVASAGGGRPVTFANKVFSQRRTVKMPRMEPSVLRRFVNCSATAIIAIESRSVSCKERVGDLIAHRKNSNVSPCKYFRASGRRLETPRRYSQ